MEETQREAREPRPLPGSGAPGGPFGRTIDLWGAGGFERLRRAHVVVIGLGGVGSHTAVALARSGVGRLRLVDIDQVSETSLNRHAVARVTDVGRPKTELMVEALGAIAPQTAVEGRRAFFHVDTAPELLAGPPDAVVDAIDGLNPKVALLRYCLEHGLPVFSSMGASARSDPGALRVGDIAESQVCPLARAVRRRLHRVGIRGGIPVVYSVEVPRAPLPPDEAPLEGRGRQRLRLPSSSALPGMFGYALAALVIARLADGRAADTAMDPGSAHESPCG